MENEQTDAGRDGRTRLARPNFRARTGTEKYSSRIGNLTLLIYALLSVKAIDYIDVMENESIKLLCKSKARMYAETLHFLLCM